MSKYQEIIRNPKTGQWEPKFYEPYTPSSSCDPDSKGVLSIKSHFHAKAAVETRQQELINAESKRQQEAYARQAEIQAQRQQEQAIRDREARIQREKELERIKQQNDSNLAKALNATRQLHRGYRG